MKSLIYLCAIAVLLVACTSNKSRSFIPGTYVDQAQGEYSIASDTLIIEASEGNNYRIHRKTGFNIITNGKKGNRQYETEEWNAVYDDGTKTMSETKNGRLITFYPEAKKLVVGKREYEKLN